VPYVITAPCVGVKDASCVEVCPVDCIYDLGEMMVIHADECIDCGVCVAECPVDAIAADYDVPAGMGRFVEIATAYVADADAARALVAGLAA
jgi:NAD-dependent dihydropyrimidine dehydrogenase PreA subunit